MRLCNSLPPPWVFAERSSDGTLYVEVCNVVWRASEQPPAEAWGNLSFTLDGGVLVLLWSGVGCFQLQTGYFYPSDGTIHWFDEGTPAQGPAEITVTPIEQGSPRYFRVVPCEETELEVPE